MSDSTIQDPTIQEACERYLDSRSDLSETTLDKTYRHTLEEYFSSVWEVSSRSVRWFCKAPETRRESLVDWMESEDYAESTIDRAVGVLDRFLAFASETWGEEQQTNDGSGEPSSSTGPATNSSSASSGDDVSNSDQDQDRVSDETAAFDTRGLGPSIWNRSGALIGILLLLFMLAGMIYLVI